MVVNDQLKNTVTAGNGETKGKVVGTRRCRLEGCLGRCIGVRWPDNKLTWPCTKGMKSLGDGNWQILVV